MTYAPAAPLGEFRVGNVLNRAMGMCVANFPFFFVVTLILAVPNLFFTLSLTPAVPGQLPRIGWSYFAILILSIVLNTFGQAVILYGAFQRLRGEPLQPGQAVSRAMVRFLPLLGLGLLYGIAVGCAAMLLLVPGIFLAVMWAVVVPACVVEGLGPFDSMSRSAGLTKGFRWQVFGILAIVLVVSGVGSLFVGLALSPFGIMVAAVGKVVWTAVWATYWNCMLIMTYHDLRVAKEGVDTQQIASVFD